MRYREPQAAARRLEEPLFLAQTPVAPPHGSAETTTRKNTGTYLEFLRLRVRMHS
jgi:hypothetical protein